MQCCFRHKHITHDKKVMEQMLFCFPLQGEYEVYMDVNIVDDADRLLTLRVNITVQIKSTGRKNIFFQQLGAL